ncbi:MAG: hypothetical protein WAL71_09600 [Terriglobales bacterium]|jgi:hypothetical protein
MKHVYVLASLLLFVVPLSAQYYSAGTTVAYVLPNMGGEILQYSFPLAIGFWIPWQQAAKYKFQNTPNTAEMITLKSSGASELLVLNDSDFCKAGCSYDGFFTTWNAQPQIESVVLPDGSIGTRVSGTLTGTFTIGSKVYDNASARFYFETYPSKYQDNVWVNAPGALIVELQPN